MKANGDMGKYIDELKVSGRTGSMLVCIQGKRDERIFGEIYSSGLSAPVPFMDVGDLVLKMDEICGWLGVPAGTTAPRFMNREMGRKYRRATAQRPEINRDRLLGRSGQIPSEQLLKAREVLSISVRYRQDFSMQGSVRGKLTEGKTVNFRSGLELMRMMRMIEV